MISYEIFRDEQRLHATTANYGGARRCSREARCRDVAIDIEGRLENSEGQ